MTVKFGNPRFFFFLPCRLALLATEKKNVWRNRFFDIEKAWSTLNILGTLGFENNAFCNLYPKIHVFRHI
jgi:hypothetical protein